MHWGRILRNIFSNWTSYVVTAVVGFTLAPVVVRSLGNEGYGLWTLVLSLTGYFGLLDLGIRSSVGRFVTRHLALHDDHGANRILSTAFAILTTGGALALIATVVIATFFFDTLGLTQENAEAGRVALLITGLNIACILPLGVFSATLIALDRFDLLSGVNIFTELLRVALVVWFLRQGHGIVTLAVIALILSAIQYGAVAFLAKATWKSLSVRVGHVDRAACRDLLGFSIYRFIWIVANQLIFYSGAVIIGIFVGAAAITPYAIAASLINYGRNMVSLVTDTLYPSAARMDAAADAAGLHRLLVLGTRMALLVTLPVCLGFLFLGRQFITLWMGPEHAGSATMLAVLTIPQFAAMSQYASSLVLVGMARHRILAYVAISEAVANAILSVILIQSMGVIGVAWGTVIPSLVTNLVVIPLYTLRVLNLSGTAYLRDAYLRPVLCAVPVALLGYSHLNVETISWRIFAAEAFSLCAVFGLAFFFLCLDSGQRARLGAMLQREVAA